MKLVILSGLVFGCLLCCMPGASAATDDFRQVAPGCVVKHFTAPWRSKPQEVVVLRADMQAGGQEFVIDDPKARWSTFEQSLLRINESVKSRGLKVLVSLSGNVDGVISDGRITAFPDIFVPAPHQSRSYYLCIREDRLSIEPLMISGDDIGKPAPDGIIHALSSWPYYCAPVLLEGQEYDTDTGSRSKVLSQLHPRTMIGVDRAGRYLFFIVIKGRTTRYFGMSLQDSSQFIMEKLPEIHSTINLDGGHISALYISGENIARMKGQRPGRRLKNFLHVVGK